MISIRRATNGFIVEIKEDWNEDESETRVVQCDGDDEAVAVAEVARMIIDELGAFSRYSITRPYVIVAPGDKVASENCPFCLRKFEDE